MRTSNRLVILAGPSCAGKSPLHKALGRQFPELAGHLVKLVLFNSREPRPGERDGVDYHFRPRAAIEALRGESGYLVLDVRGDLQALELAQVESALSHGDAFFEGNPFVARALLDSPELAALPHLAIFLSPLAREELLEMAEPSRHIALPAFVTEVMRRKLLRRTQKQKGILGLPDLQNIETRAGSAYQELGEAWRFDHVIVNHDGEDSEHWDAFYYPIGDARKALLVLAALLAGHEPLWPTEHWEEGLLPLAR